MSVILTLNTGSSSLKFALYEHAAEPIETLRGQLDGFGAGARLKLAGQVREVAPKDHAEAMALILSDVAAEVGTSEIAAVGHRIVHGGRAFSKPALIDAEVLEALSKLEPLAPLHQPHNLAAVRAARDAFPTAKQVGCFDTAFHRTQSRVAELLAIPRALFDEGVQCYGFHGLSYDYLSEELAARYPALHAGKVVVAHLGSGASMAALVGGRSVATSMGFSALDGLPMGTRPGQIDPGVLLYLLDEKGMDSKALTTFLYKDCGLLGLSGISNDMRVLEASDAPEASEAIAYFTDRIRRQVGSLAAAMDGIDGIVFTGGVGENSARVRHEVLEGLSLFGFACDLPANDAHATEIGGAGKPALVLPTNEELVIARSAAAFL